MKLKRMDYLVNVLPCFNLQLFTRFVWVINIPQGQPFEFFYYHIRKIDKIRIVIYLYDFFFFFNSRKSINEIRKFDKTNIRYFSKYTRNKQSSLYLVLLNSALKKLKVGEDIEKVIMNIPLVLKRMKGYANTKALFPRDISTFLKSFRFLFYEDIPSRLSFPREDTLR